MGYANAHVDPTGLSVGLLAADRLLRPRLAPLRRGALPIGRCRSAIKALRAEVKVVKVGDKRGATYALAH